MAVETRLYFEDMFSHPTMIPRFKARVSTSADRWKARGFSSNATILESISALAHAQTNYAVILRDILKLEREGYGSVAHVAGIRFLIDANHTAVGKAGAGTLAFMHSTMTRSTPAEQLYKPVHRLLVEEDVFAFSWSPLLSKSYYAVMAIIHTAKLASAVVSTVGSLGAAAPALIEAIGSAASTLQDVVKLVSAVQDASSILVEGVTTAREEASTAREYMRASSNPSEFGIGSTVTSSQATDLGAHTARVERGKVSTYLGLSSRLETDDEMRKRVGREMLDFEGEVQKLNFVVVQRVTPVLQVRDKIDVTDPTKPNATFETKTYMSNQSLVRAGETSRDKFAQMVMAQKNESFSTPAAAELFCRPWAAENIYRQWKEAPGPQMGTGASDQDFGSLDWALGTSWELVDTRTGTLPLPAGILTARVRFEERARARAARAGLLGSQTGSKMLMLAGRAKGAVSQNRIDTQHRLIQNSNLPEVRDFQTETTTYSVFGSYKNARNNPLLLNIDTQLAYWQKIKKNNSFNVISAVQALNCIILACEDYIEQKNTATQQSGHASERLPAVTRLKNAAESLCRQLA